MIHRLPALLLILTLALPIAGCDAILGIMEFGFWVGVIVVVAIVAIVAWIVRSMRGPRDTPPPPAA